jgi:hypothetical protein
MGVYIVGTVAKLALPLQCYPDLWNLNRCVSLRGYEQNNEFYSQVLDSS